LLLLTPTRHASADKVDTLIKRMLTSTSYKKRLGAALRLRKLGGTRAIPAYVRALSDADKTVRGVAARVLGQLVDGTTKGDVRAAALAKLERVAANDKSAFVRKHAQKARAAIQQSSGGKNAYVKVVVLSHSKGLGKKQAKRVSAVVRKRLRKEPWIVTRWPGGSAPTASVLKKLGMGGYSLEVDVKTFTLERHGATATVSCEVFMRLADYPAKNRLASSKGTAKVQASARRSAIGSAKKDCVYAVTTDLVKRTIIPTIKKGTPARSSYRAHAKALASTTAVVQVSSESGGEEPWREELAVSDTKCRFGGGEQCVAAGRDKLGFDDKLAAALLQEGCNAGEPLGCVAKADLLSTDSSDNDAGRRAAKLYEAACDADEPAGCWKLGKLNLRGEAVTQDPDKAVRLFQRACQLGSQAGCDFTDTMSAD
jgi:hypothetical protein